MKQAIIILGIIGSLGTFVWGLKWFNDYSEFKYNFPDKDSSVIVARPGSVNSAIAEYESTGHASYFLLVGSLLSIMAVLMLKRLGKLSAVILLAAALTPVIFVPKSIVIMSILLLASLLIFILKPVKERTERNIPSF
jgi:hypothetical protein